MRVFKYIDAHWGLIALHEQRLKISRILEVNDPFEFRSLAPKDKKNRNKYNHLLKSQNEENGFISFSKTWQEPLLWSHYSDSHKGLCLEFEALDEDAFWEVEYVDKRDEFSFDPDDMSEEDFNKLLSNLPKKKYKAWSYEQEVRATFKFGTASTNGLNFIPIDNRLKLNTVILGAKYQSTNSNLNESLAAAGVQVKTTRLDFKHFKVSEQNHLKMQKRL